MCVLCVCVVVVVVGGVRDPVVGRCLFPRALFMRLGRRPLARGQGERGWGGRPTGQWQQACAITYENGREIFVTVYEQCSMQYAYIGLILSFFAF